MDVARRRPTLGLVLCTIREDLHFEWLGSMDAARALGCDLICFPGRALDDIEGFTAQENGLYDLITAQRLDGLIVWTTPLGLYAGQEQTEAFCRRFDPLPVITLESPLGDAPMLLMEERQGVYDVVSHLIEAHDRQRIAFVRGPANHVGAGRRYQGYLDAMAAHGLPVDPDLVCGGTGLGWGPDVAADAVSKMLAGLTEPPDAIATANDDFALGAMSACEARGLSTPRDVAIVGFDAFTNIRSLDLYVSFQGFKDMPGTDAADRLVRVGAGSVSLTSVRVPFYELGWRAVELLVDRLDGREVAPVTVVPTEVVMGTSCGCLPGGPRSSRAATALPAATSAVRDSRDRPAAAAHLRSALALPGPWADRLVTAFLAEADGSTTDAYLHTLYDLVRLGLKDGESLDLWYDALAALHSSALECLTPEQLARVDSVWKRARLLIDDLAERVREYEHLLADRRDQTVREAGQRLMTAPDAEAIAEAAALELPRLGINSCYIAAYAGSTEDRRSMARLLLSYEDGTRRQVNTGRPFPATEIVPGDGLDRAEPVCWIVCALYFKTDDLGYVVFQLGPRIGWIYEALQHQLSSALQGALMVELLQQEIRQREGAESALQNAHDLLEVRVADRTRELAHANDVLAQQILERERAEEMQRTLEVQLRHAQKMEAIGRLAGGIAHDFNNLLVVINGISGLMLDDPALSESVRSDLQDIQHAGDRAASLTRQLLAFSRQQVLHPGALDINDVVVAMEGMLRRVIGEAIVLTTELSPNLHSIWADTGQIEQILVNLVVNARDAMPMGGAVRIETLNATLSPGPSTPPNWVPGDYAVLRISDTGVGMDEATRARLFEPFFTTKPVGKGTGLGLATVFGIVEQSGGHIAVDSAPGAGATFEVHLPRMAQGLSAQVDVRPEGSAAKGSETVLLVEDDTTVRRAVHRFLTTRGYTVLDAVDGRNALQLVADAEVAIDLVITDVVMPGMSGPEFVGRLATLMPDTPVLYVSGYTEDARETAFDDDAVLLEKPFTAETLVAKVREILDQ